MQFWTIAILGILLVILLERRSRLRARKVREPGILRLDAGTADELRDLLRQGKKIEAIKLYRHRSGAGLKAAKDAVEDLERQPQG